MNPPSILSLAAQTAGQPADLTFLAYLDIWIISGLVLLAVVVVLGKLVWGKLRRRDETDEYGYYDREVDLDEAHDGHEDDDYREGR